MLFDQFGGLIAPGQAPRIWTPSRRIERIPLPIRRRRERPTLEAAIAVVQTDGTMHGAATNLGVLVPAVNPTTGNYLISVSSYFANGGAMTMTDDTGLNTWVKALDSPSIGGSFNRASIWYTKVASSGPMTLQWNLPSGSYIAGGFLEASGIAASSPFDASGGNSGAPETSAPHLFGGTSTTAFSTGTLSQADELVITALNSNQLSNEAVTVFTPSGFSSIFSNLDGAIYEYGEGRYKIVSATTSIAPQWEFPGFGNLYSGCIATFKAAGGGSSAVTRAGGMVM